MSAEKDWDALAVVSGAIAASGAGLHALATEDAVWAGLPLDVQESLQRIFAAFRDLGTVLEAAREEQP